MAEFVGAIFLLVFNVSVYTNFIQYMWRKGKGMGRKRNPAATSVYLLVLALAFLAVDPVCTILKHVGWDTFSAQNLPRYTACEGEGANRKCKKSTFFGWCLWATTLTGLVVMAVAMWAYTVAMGSNCVVTAYDIAYSSGSAGPRKESKTSAGRDQSGSREGAQEMDQMEPAVNVEPFDFEAQMAILRDDVDLLGAQMEPIALAPGFGYDEVQKRASVAESSVERVPSSASFVGKKISTAVAAAGQKVAKFFFSDDEADEHLDGGLADPESDNWSTVWRFLWWSLRPVIVLPLLIYFCAWVCIKSWQITGAGCYYNTEMISSVERSGCGWNHRGGFCDISELADMKPFEFLLPRLSHYTVSDLLIPFVILGNAGTTWVFFQELLSLWSIQSQLANFALYLAAYLGAFIAYRDSNFSAALFFRIGGGMFAGTAGILIVRPRRVPFRTMAKVLLCASTYTVYAWIGAFFVPVVLRPLQQHMQEEENNYSDLQRGIVELFVANLFSSWYVPLGARIVGKYICKAALVAVEFNYGTLSPTDKFEVEKYMRMLINRGLDVFRYTFGRSVFLKLSPMVIAFLVLKDVVYDVLHFGMGFDPFVLFSGNFLLQFAMLGCILTWDPYDMVAVRLRTGVPELGFEHIRRGCVLQYGADGNPMKK
eukprot:g8546.t1